jgi:taurine dioxygenase
MPNSNLQIRRITGSLGAEITGVDFLSLSESVFEEIHQALLDYEVLFFPGCALDDTQQMALAHRFGQPSVFPVLQLLGSTEPSFQVIEDGPDSPNEADYWHTDVTWTSEPPKIALLRAGIMPTSGGDTAWASMSAAYQALSPAMQEILCKLEVRHDNDRIRKLGKRPARDLPPRDTPPGAYTSRNRPARPPLGRTFHEKHCRHAPR